MFLALTTIRFDTYPIQDEEPDSFLDTEITSSPAVRSKLLLSSLDSGDRRQSRGLPMLRSVTAALAPLIRPFGPIIILIPQKVSVH